MAPGSLSAQRGPVMQAAKPRTPAPGSCQTPTARTPTANGRNKGLLRRVRAPGDCQTYGAFYDWGWWSFHQYAGQANLPAAYWVYHYPYWYLWQHRRP